MTDIYNHCIIDNFDQLVKTITNSGANDHPSAPSKKIVLVAMFKSERCPPCSQTMRHFLTVGTDGKTNLSHYIDNFNKCHEKENIELRFMAIDLQRLQTEILPVHLSLLSELVKASHKVRGIPTFEPFVIQEGSMKHIEQCSYMGAMSKEDQFVSYISDIVHYMH